MTLLKTSLKQTSQNKLAKHAIKVHKFGGSSLATAQAITRVVDIIRQNCQLNDLIVVSANGKTTDSLFALLSLTSQHDYAHSLREIAQQQFILIDELLNKTSAMQLTQLLSADIAQLTQCLSSDNRQSSNDILAFGELWSARLLSALLNEQICPSIMLDARDFLVIDSEQQSTVDNALSSAQLNTRIQFW